MNPEDSAMERLLEKLERMMGLVQIGSPEVEWITPTHYLGESA